MSGTGIAYAAVSGTDSAYPATRCAVLTEGMLLRNGCYRPDVLGILTYRMLLCGAGYCPSVRRQRTCSTDLSDATT
eukprot:3210055-Rhodomonas_salina.1